MQEFFLDYCLTQELSHKKSRHTYLAHAWQDAQQKLVIKIFDPDCVNPEQEQEQGMLLADILLSLRHPHIVPILDIAIKQGRPYVVSEYRPHGSLGQRLERLSPERMDWPEAVSIVIQLGQALCYAHEHRIVHGNLKPENVFYDMDGEVQLTDFSLTSFIDVAKLDYKSDLSTIRYMAQEQFMGKTDQQSDQYSLACLAYELITGKPPFNAASFTSLWGKHATEYAAPLASAVPKIPMPIDLAILKALAKKPQERYEDVAAFVAALERGLAIQVVDYALPRLNSSVANNADAFLLDNPRSNPFFTEQPISSAGNPRSLSGTRPLPPSGTRPLPPSGTRPLPPQAGNTRPLSRPSGELGPASPENTLAASPLPAVPENAEEVNLFESLSTPNPSTPGRIELGYEALRSYAQTTNALHLHASDTHADHEDLPALDGAEQHVADAPEQSERASARQAAASQTTEVVAVSSARLPQSRGRKKAPVFWISLVSILVILVGTLGLSVFGASFLPLHLSNIDGQQVIQSGSTQTVVAYATDALPVTPAARSRVQQQATVGAHATVPTSLQPSLLPTATPTAKSAPKTGTGSTRATPTPVPIVPTPTPTPKPSGTGSVQINAGGAGSGAYIADTDFTGGAESDTGTTVDTSDVSNPAPESVYLTNRVGGSFSYSIPDLTPGDAYTVRLHFAETYWKKAGKRVFNVAIDGQTVLSNFDIIATAGGADIAVVEAFTVTAPSSGTMTILFTSDVDQAQINAIQVLAD